MSNPILDENENINSNLNTNNVQTQYVDNKIKCLFCNQEFNLTITEHTCLISNDYKSIVVYSNN